MPNFDFLSPAASDLVSDLAMSNYGNLGKPGAIGDLGNIDGDLFSRAVTQETMAACCRSGLWLLHNRLEESHSISQSIEVPEGSYWHGIMHRMEGDFGNSKYWFRCVGHHRVFDSLDRDLPGGFDPSRFVDDCQSAAAGDTTLAGQCHDVAVAEWIALFEFCGRAAVG